MAERKRIYKEGRAEIVLGEILMSKFKLSGQGTDKAFQQFLSEFGETPEPEEVDQQTQSRNLSQTVEPVTNAVEKSPVSVGNFDTPDAEPNRNSLLFGDISYEQINQMLLNMPAIQETNQKLSQQSLDIKQIKESLNIVIQKTIEFSTQINEKVSKLEEENKQIKNIIGEFGKYFMAGQAGGGNGGEPQTFQIQAPQIQQPQLPQTKLQKLAEFGPALAQLLPMFQQAAPPPPPPQDPFTSPAFQALIQMMGFVNQQRREGTAELIDTMKAIKTMNEVTK